MTFGLFNNKNLTNPKYQEVTYYGLSIDKEVSDTSVIEVQGKKYKVMFVNPYGRLTEVYLSEY